MKNLIIIESTDTNEIAKKIPLNGAHFTNGTYAYSADLIIPTTLSGFEYVDSLRRLPMVLAVNSDISMKALGKKDFEPQLVRANKVALPLAERFPVNEVIVLFYDEETPFNLYQSLAKHGDGTITRTLHKWGYGTEPGAPKIEGAEFFESVYAFPLPNDTKPVCYYDTNLPDKPQNVTVVDLRKGMLKTASKGIFPQIKDFAYERRYTLFAASAAAAVAISAYVIFSDTDKDVNPTYSV